VTEAGSAQFAGNRENECKCLQNRTSKAVNPRQTANYSIGYGTRIALECSGNSRFPF